VPAAKVATISNGIDTTLFAPGPSDVRARLLAKGVGRFVIGCVARFEPVKNHELLLRAFSDARQTRSELLLVLVGDGRLRSSLEDLARQLGIAEAVAFVGDQKDTAPWYRAFDAFVLSSHAEGTSMSILEAMASARAVIATNVGGNARLLANQQCGRLVPPGDRAALASAILEVATSSELRDQLGRAARDRVDRHFSHRAMVERYDAIYREALGR
jgi:glycosyltransferase involved in cell wall biosynthesis